MIALGTRAWGKEALHLSLADLIRQSRHRLTQTPLWITGSSPVMTNEVWQRSDLKEFISSRILLETPLLKLARPGFRQRWRVRPAAAAPLGPAQAVLVLRRARLPPEIGAEVLGVGGLAGRQQEDQGHDPKGRLDRRHVGFSGDRGWRRLARDSREVAAFLDSLQGLFVLARYAVLKAFRAVRGAPPPRPCQLQAKATPGHDGHMIGTSARSSSI